MKALLIFLLTITGAQAFDWQGHRGARGIYPENSLEAMEGALHFPITTLEFDVVVTKDQQVILSHEPWMNKLICQTPSKKRIKGKEFNIYHMTYEEVQQFDCGSLPHPDFPEQKKMKVIKPTLRAVLTQIEKKNKNIFYNIEIKSSLAYEKQGYQPHYQEMSDLVIKEVRNYLPESRFSIQSFDWRVLKYLNQKYPAITLVALKQGQFNTKEIINELGFKPRIFSPAFKHLNSKKVSELKKQGMKVIPWTVNEVRDLKRVKEMGVDGIITDYPNRIEK